MIDRARLKELRDIMDEDFPDLVEIFFDDTKHRFNNLKALLEQKTLDNIAIKTEAHTLKGSSGNLFATELQQLFFKLERLAFENRLDEQADLMQQIADEIEVVFQELIDFD